LRQEDKELDGPDLEQAEERKRETELVEEPEDKLYDLDGQYETTVDPGVRASVVDAMRSIFERENLVINDLALSKRHLMALEALKTAVEGRDSELARFVYAEDRRTLLEQALAILQPELATLDHLSKPFDDLIKDVGQLRDKLNTLEDSEEELVEGRFKDSIVRDGDTEDDDKPTEVDDDTSLTGPERQIARPPSSLAGPARTSDPKLPTTLGDPDEIATAQNAKTAEATKRRRPGE
jgi:hypothetical protein